MEKKGKERDSDIVINLKRSFLSFVMVMFLVSGMILGISPQIVFAAPSGKCGDNINWVLNGKTLTITGSGAMYDFEYNGNTDDRPWKQDEVRKKTTHIKLSDGITKIGKNAFRNFDSLQSIDVPDSISSIGENAFMDSSLSSFKFPKKLSIIRKGVFQNTKLTSVSIPNHVTTVEHAFDYCHQLKSVKIANSVKKIEGFTSCDSLETVDFGTGITDLSSVLFSKCDSLTEAPIPPNLKETATNEETGSYVFDTCKGVTHAVIPGSLKTFGRFFHYCNHLESIQISSGVERIEGYAAISCHKLKKIFIPASVTYIGAVPFYQESITDIYYEGNESQWKAISTDEDWRTDWYPFIKRAIIHFNSTGFDGGQGTISASSDSASASQESKQLLFANGHDFATVNWSWDLFNNSASIYNSDLAYTALWLSDATEHSMQKATNAFKKLGFSEIYGDYYNDDDLWIHNRAAYSIGCKEAIVGGQRRLIVGMALRGTKDIRDLITKDIWGGGINGFLDIGTTMYNEMDSYIQKKYPNYTKSDVILYITGHSLGGATAGQVARLAYKHGYPPNSTFTYTFASPNYDIEKDNPSMFGNVFNIINIRDVVPFIVAPKEAGWFTGARKRIGTDIYYAELKLTPIQTHITETYLQCMKIGNKVSAPPSFSYISILCPVDIEIYDSEKNLVGKTNGETYKNEGIGDIAIFTDGDKKFVFSVTDNYTIRFTGTGSGSMEYRVNRCDASTGEIISTKTFKNVMITPGKKFYSVINNDSDSLKTKLYTTNDTFQMAIMEVLEDGTETPASVTPTSTAPASTYSGNTSNYTSSSSGGSSGGSSSSRAKSYTTGKGTYKASYSKTGKKTVKYDTYRGSFKSKKATVPSTVKIGKKKYKVTSIAENAFTGYDKLEMVSIGKNIKKIGRNAFGGCSKLKTLQIMSKKLKKKAVKKAFEDSAIKNVYVQKDKVKNYKHIFTKKNTGSKTGIKVKAKR